MKQWSVLVLFAAFSLQIQVMAQARRSPVLADRAALVEPGVVVDEVETGKEAAAAGLKEGDVLLSWSRDGAGVKIESPFDFIWVDIEQRPRGEITLAGLRGREKRSWKLRGGEWGLATRPNFAGKLAAVYRRSRAMEKAGNPSGAARYWSKASRGVPLDEVAWLPAWAVFHKALLYRRVNDLHQSDLAYAKAVQLSGEKNPIAASRILNSWGGLHCHRSEWHIAEKYFRESIEALPATEEGSLYAAFLLENLGAVLLLEARFPEAEDVLNRVVAIRQKLAPQSLELATGLCWLGELDMARDDIQSAYGVFSQALSIQQQHASESPDMGSALTNLGKIEEFRGELAAAQRRYEQVLAARTQMATNSVSVANALMGLGSIAMQRDDVQGALRYFRKTLHFQKKTRAHPLQIAATYGNLGEVLVDSGRMREGQYYLHLSLGIEDKFAPNKSSEAWILVNLGWAARLQGHYRSGEQYLKRALTMEQGFASISEIRAVTLWQLAELERARGHLALAESYYLTALPLSKHAAPGSFSYADVLGGFAELAYLMGKNDLSGQLFEQSLMALESQTARLGSTAEISADYRANHYKYYSEYIDLLVARKKPAQAFRILERSRARMLVEMLSASRVDVHQGGDPALLKRERELQAKIRAKSERRVRVFAEQDSKAQTQMLESQISDLARQYEEVEAQLRTSSPAYAALTQPQPLTAEQVQHELLDSDTVLLEYSLGEKRSYVFAVTPTGLDVVALPGRRTIERLAMRLHHLMKTQSGANNQRSETQYEQTAAALGRMVLKPVAEQIRGKRIGVVADGALHYVPFASLPDPGEGNGRMKTTPLIAGHEVVNLPSASVLAILRQQERTGESGTKAVAVLADPVFDKQDQRVLAARAAAKRRTGRTETVAKVGPVPVWNLATPPLTRSAVDVGLGRDGQVHLPRLRFTRLEANAILAVTPPGAGREALDFDASRATAMSPELGQYRIIHFATHGLLDSRHPELSGLVFSLVDRNGRTQNGFLDLQDIYNLDLHADLVVLSACETGLGRQISGEGIVGLTRGFMYAGASRVVASLWKVSDVATARLMTYFYQGMEKEGLAPAAALRAAQIKMLHGRWSNPYYWAAFQIQGEWK